jgi:hypothetical protein
MKIKRALFRLWLVFSVCWGVFVLVGFYLVHNDVGSTSPAQFMAIGVVPPSLVFVLGSAVIWAVGGFERR